MVELEATLVHVVFIVETRRSTHQARSLFLAGMSMGESCGGYFNLQLSGLTGICSQSADLLKNVDEVALKYSAIVQLDPVLRLSMGIAHLALAVDQANRKNNTVKNDTPSNIQSTFSDL